MALVVACLPTGSETNVAPCVTNAAGQATQPVAIDLADLEPLAAGQAGELFAAALTVVIVAFFVGSVVGGILRLIRSV